MVELLHGFDVTIARNLGHRSRFVWNSEVEGLGVLREVDPVSTSS